MLSGLPKHPVPATLLNVVLLNLSLITYHAHCGLSVTVCHLSLLVYHPYTNYVLDYSVFGFLTLVISVLI